LKEARDKGGKVRGKYILLSVLPMLVLLGTLSCQPPASRPKKSIVVTYSVLGSLVKELVGDKATVTVSIPKVWTRMNGNHPLKI
jgi:zinc/manganese transport system substrate-binding protein